MKVIWRQKGHDWEIASGESYRDEAQLQSFLSDNPTLIPFEDVSSEILTPKVMIREVGLPGSGHTDIVGVDEHGEITIIECKLATNPEVKRKVIGQVLEYAAFLWRKPYSFLDEIAAKRLEKPLAEAMVEALDDEARAEWDKDDFVEAVSNSLELGTFRIVVAVDAVNEELRRTIEYLAEGPSNLEVFALEITYFTSGEREILIPHLHGSVSRKSPAGKRMKQWTEERFFDDAQNRDLPPEIVELMKDLLEFTSSEASRAYWGIGKETGSFTFHHLQNDQTYSIFSVYSNGRINVNIGWLIPKVPEELVADFWESLKSIGGFGNLRVRDDFNSWPSIVLSEGFGSDDDMKLFKEVVIRFRNDIIREA